MNVVVGGQLQQSFDNISKANLHQLQNVHNAAERHVINSKRIESMTQTLKELHCLGVEPKIVRKMLQLLFKDMDNTLKT